MRGPYPSASRDATLGKRRNDIWQGSRGPEGLHLRRVRHGGGLARSLIADLPKLGKKYGIETDWTSFADDWRGLYQPQMTRVRKGELPWTRIDDLHKEAFEMLLKKRGLKHPGEAGSWEFTHLWHKLRPWPDSSRASA